MISSPISPAPTGTPPGSTTARSQPASGEPDAHRLPRPRAAPRRRRRWPRWVRRCSRPPVRAPPRGPRGSAGRPRRRRSAGGPGRGHRRATAPASVGTVDTIGDPLGGEPRPEVHPGPHQRARGGDQAGAVAPRQPHLLAGRVEGDRQPGQHPVIGTDRARSTRNRLGLGVDEGRGRPMRDGDALGHAGRARGEDDPGVVVDRRRPSVAGRPTAARRLDLEAVARPRRRPPPPRTRGRLAPPGRRRRRARRPPRRGARRGWRRRGRSCRT